MNGCPTLLILTRDYDLASHSRWQDARSDCHYPSAGTGSVRLVWVKALKRQQRIKIHPKKHRWASLTQKLTALKALKNNR